MFKRLGQLVVMLLLITLLIPVIKIVSYSQDDNEKHLAEKKAYLASLAELPRAAPTIRPNIILILLDDMGYGDLSSYGSKAIDTPNIDRLAEQGVRFTHYYSPSPSCTPSRAGLLTGRYPPRAGLMTVVHPSGSNYDKFIRFNGLPVRLPADEILMSEVLRAAGYATAMIGKWHLGDFSPSLPTDMGFDDFYGALYSNDMPPFEIYHNKEVVVPEPVDQTMLNERYFSQAKNVVKNADKNKPFFLYFAHNFPHVPLYSSAQHSGQSNGGRFGDVMEDIDRGVGELVATLKAENLLANTLILITSDNGPWFQGNPGQSRGRKFMTWDGGVRVPFIAHWPSAIPAGKTIDTPVVGVDILPTLMSLLALPLPKDRLLDGQDITATLAGDETANRDRLIYYFNANVLDAVRDRRFKYHRQRGVHASDIGDIGAVYSKRGPFLFDYSLDTHESYDVSDRHPAERERMRVLLEKKKAEMDRNPRGWID